MTFSDDAIIAAQVVDHSETPKYASAAINDIPNDVVEYQSLGIDVASGATYTSDAILEAIEDCVVQAGGDPDSLR